MKLFTIFVVWLVPDVYTAQLQQFDKEDLDFVNLVHVSFCGYRSVCNSEGNRLAVSDATTKRLNDLPIPVPDMLPIDCCKPCSCNKSTCADYGSCCPDILDHLTSPEDSRVNRRAVCRMSSLRNLAKNTNYWMFESCSRDFIVENNQTAVKIKSKCENSNEYFDVETRQPVVSPITNQTFMNRFCAMCNFVEGSSLVPWTPRVACYGKDSFFKSVNISSLIKDVLSSKSCDLEFFLQMEVNNPRPTCRNLVTQCNVTGQWKHYDPTIEAACHAYSAEYDFTYNNIFCFQCNELEKTDYCYDSIGPGIAFAAVSFSAVLDFNRRTTPIKDTSTQCFNSQVYDHFKGECRDLTCIFPRILQRGECINIGDTMTEVAYTFQLKLHPIGLYEASEIDNMASMIGNYTETLLVNWRSLNAVVKYGLFYKTTLEASDDTEPGETLLTQRVTTPIIPRKNVVVSSIVPDVSEMLDMSDNGDVEMTPIMTVNYLIWKVEWYFKDRISGKHSADFVDNILKLDGTIVTLNGSTMTSPSINISLNITDFESDEFGNPVDPGDNTPLTNSPIKVVSPRISYLIPVLSPIQALKHTLVCPMVTLYNSEYNIVETPFGLFVKELNTTFDKKYYKRESVDQNTNAYSICKDTYVRITDIYISKDTLGRGIETRITPQGVLSVVCACISILFSFLTLVTYLLFDKLRTQPGINNIFVCVYLICAQAFFTFATPQADIVSDYVCALLGALVHFFWLMVVFAMNVCCYHMAMVFIGQSANISKPASKLTKSLLYTIYCSLSSLMIVSINIIVAAVDTNKAQTGYGDGICYISRPKMIGYVFALPLGMTLLINLAFFVTVVIKISRSPNVSSSNKKNRNFFKIYAKLSSVTGLTWIFGFLFELTDVVVFEYAFIILNGNIGVLLFLSFVCNKRIYNMYKEMFAKTVSRTEIGKTIGQSSKTKATELSRKQSKCKYNYTPGVLFFLFKQRARVNFRSETM